MDNDVLEYDIWTHQLNKFSARSEALPPNS